MKSAGPRTFGAFCLRVLDSALITLSVSIAARFVFGWASDDVKVIVGMCAILLFFMLALGGANLPDEEEKS